MRFAVLADAHIGRSIPLAIAEHRRKAFTEAFRKAVDAILDIGVDYIFICGDLFERRTLRPHLVQFVHDELYRLATETLERHGYEPKILVVRGNHDGRPLSDTLDYIRHPLAKYLHVFDEEHLVYDDGRLHVVGLGYYENVSKAYEKLVRPAFEGAEGLRVLMLHTFIQGYQEVPLYSPSLTIDDLAEVDPRYVFAGHHHERHRPRRLPNGGWLLTPGSLEMYDFGEKPEKGFYIVEDAEASEPSFKWIPIEPMHVMRRIPVASDRRRPPEWYAQRILEAVEGFVEELRRLKKPGYLRVPVTGPLSEGLPSDVDLEEVDRIREEEPLLLWVDVETMGLEMPPFMPPPGGEEVAVEEFFQDFGPFAEEIGEMHERVRESLEEEASVETGLLTPSRRRPLIEEWLKRFEGRSFRGEQP
ncbi:MAG: DNA repair exonuclease [Candidatus Bathyarchaeota archaeon B23]|nr:MAG: DNA repair exonuclease [Candidatus Bathyarchaeota archaeon B23]